MTRHSSEIADELTKLANLHSDGSLTDEEFAMLKTKLLSEPFFQSIDAPKDTPPNPPESKDTPHRASADSPIAPRETWLEKGIAVFFRKHGEDTWFYKWGRTGVIVSASQACELQALLRLLYRWVIPIVLVAIPISPFFSASYWPAILLYYSWNSADITHVTSTPDLISHVQSKRTLSGKLPNWFIWMVIVLCTLWLLFQSTSFVSERFSTPSDGEQMIIDLFGILVGSSCLAIAVSLLNIRRRIVRDPPK